MKYTEKIDFRGVPIEATAERSNNGVWKAHAMWRGIRYESLAESRDEAVELLISALASAAGVSKDSVQINRGTP